MIKLTSCNMMGDAEPNEEKLNSKHDRATSCVMGQVNFEQRPEERYSSVESSQLYL